MVGHGRTAAHNKATIHARQFLEEKAGYAAAFSRRRECEFRIGFDIVGNSRADFHRDVGVGDKQVGRARNQAIGRKLLMGS
jgi:hypothetical protein